MGDLEMGSLQSCGPFDCAKYGSRTLYNITSSAIQKWLPQANAAGKAYGMNPATLLALASVETNGNPTAIDPTGSTYGIVQIGSDHLNAYNCAHGTSYTLNDLIGKGTIVKDTTTAVQVSFNILAQYLKAMTTKTSSFKLSATGWNGAMCGYSGSIAPYGSGCGNWPVPTKASGYGEAAYKLASAYSPWWINPNTGQASSFYFGDLQEAPSGALPVYTTVCFGP